VCQTQKSAGDGTHQSAEALICASEPQTAFGSGHGSGDRVKWAALLLCVQVGEEGHSGHCPLVPVDIESLGFDMEKPRVLKMWANAEQDTD
jgi:hypothetical protein